MEAESTEVKKDLNLISSYTNSLRDEYGRSFKTVNDLAESFTQNSSDLGISWNSNIDKLDDFAKNVKGGHIILDLYFNDTLPNKNHYKMNCLLTQVGAGSARMLGPNYEPLPEKKEYLDLDGIKNRQFGTLLNPIINNNEGDFEANTFEYNFLQHLDKGSFSTLRVLSGNWYHYKNTGTYYSKISLAFFF